MESRIIQKVRECKPLIHCITNYVTAGDVANMLLAAGGSPIMADGIREAEEITSICRGLVINLGTLNEWRLESMLKAGAKAAQMSHPIVLDPVGVGASAFRMEAAGRLLSELPCQVICGNASEIMALAKGMPDDSWQDESTGSADRVGHVRGVDAGCGDRVGHIRGVDAGRGDRVGHIRGVDADRSDGVDANRLEQMCQMVKWLSRRTHAVIVMTGAMDLVGDGQRVYIIKNGHPMMEGITGSGCMLNGVIAAYVSTHPGCVLEAAALAAAAVGLCGELAYERVVKEDGGLGSFRVYFIDFMSKLDDQQLKGGKKIEIR